MPEAISRQYLAGHREVKWAQPSAQQQGPPAAVKQRPGLPPTCRIYRGPCCRRCRSARRAGCHQTGRPAPGHPARARLGRTARHQWRHRPPPAHARAAAGAAPQPTRAPARSRRRGARASRCAARGSAAAHARRHARLRHARRLGCRLGCRGLRGPRRPRQLPPPPHRHLGTAAGACLRSGRAGWVSGSWARATGERQHANRHQGLLRPAE